MFNNIEFFGSFYGRGINLSMCDNNIGINWETGESFLIIGNKSVKSKSFEVVEL